MINEILNYDDYKEYVISENEFLKDVLTMCYEKHIIDENKLSKIGYERMELLKIKLEYYTQSESSSVMVEEAENVLLGIDYTIGVYLKKFHDINIIIEKIKDTKLSEMLNLGYELINNKVVDSENLLKYIFINKLKTNNYSYNDTINYGIPLFFKEYDDFFASNEMPGSIDYQLYIDDMEYIGIDYIYDYLNKLRLENEFCHKFESKQIDQLLCGYSKNFEVLLINIFEIVLINSLGLIICGKNLSCLDINRFDREIIKNKLQKLSLDLLQEELMKASKICCDILDIENNQLLKYIKKSVVKIALLINERIKLDELEKIFISFRCELNESSVYIDGEKMKDYEFRILNKEIRECSSTEIKIEIIKNNIKSLEDLVDILSSDCLFEDEYIMYFKSMSDIEITLLLKYIETTSLGYEKELYIRFNKYILTLK